MAVVKRERCDEWRAVAPSGRIVQAFSSKDLARDWLVIHKQHSVSIVRVVTTTVTEIDNELQ